ncbi:Alpha-tocopherol transfer protein-like protein [Cyphomyrmex costatus]|uniref:Alpha-tocopherol transfer protein-like protein n=1 Tax=Cyphomyrmex costatus TaxID=456900 RepID=A0A151IM35_9HYME|nr:Alpha-tocopherol transfer protein-like protein [Cyphomyrmex costatus]
MANMSSYDDSIKSYALHGLTSEDKKYAATYLNETDETRKSAIEEIKRWIEESDDLHDRLDDFLILRFLRVSKFDLEKTKIRIRNFLKQRFDLPEWFTNTDPLQPELQEILDLGTLLPLRKPDNQGRIIYIVRGTVHDPRIHKISNIFKISRMAMDIAMKYYPVGSVYGYMIFSDVSNITLGHITQLRPYVIMNYVRAMQNCYPGRIQSMTIFNAPVIFDIVTRIFKTFMTQKLKSRFNVYSSQNCFKDIPANILPVEYGGTDGTIQELTDYWKKLIEENREWLLTDDNNDKITILRR